MKKSFVLVGKLHLLFFVLLFCLVEISVAKTVDTSTSKATSFDRVFPVTQNNIKNIESALVKFKLKHKVPKFLKKLHSKKYSNFDLYYSLMSELGKDWVNSRQYTPGFEKTIRENLSIFRSIKYVAKTPLANISTKTCIDKDFKKEILEKCKKLHSGAKTDYEIATRVYQVLATYDYDIEKDVSVLDDLILQQLKTKSSTPITLSYINDEFDEVVENFSEQEKKELNSKIRDILGTSILHLDLEYMNQVADEAAKLHERGLKLHERGLKLHERGLKLQERGLKAQYSACKLGLAGSSVGFGMTPGTKEYLECKKIINDYEKKHPKAK